MAVLDRLRITQESGEEFEPEFDDEFPPDPAPDEKPRKSRKEPVVKAPVRRRKSADTLAKEVGNDLGGVFEMVAAAWQMSGDHCCAPVLEEQARPIGAALANILKRYPNLLEKMANSDYLSLGLSAAMLTTAVKPVVVAVYRNHVVKEGADDHGDPIGDALAAQFSNNAPDLAAGRPTR